MLRQLTTLSFNTFVESIRQPVFVVLVISGSIGLWFNTPLAAYTLENDNKLMIDLGLSTLFLTGLLLAAFTATGVLSAEIESGTALTVVSKPVARPLFVLGKYLGVAAALTLAYLALTMVYLLNVRHQVMQTARDNIDWPVLAFAFGAFGLSTLIAAGGNYLYHWVFTSTFTVYYTILNSLAWLLVPVINKNWEFQSIATEFIKQGGHLFQILIALVMLFEAILILTAVAVLVSIRVGQVMTMVICFAVFLLGLVSNSLYDPTASGQHILAALLYWIVPNLQYLWQADALTAGHAISASHVLFVSCYSILYIAAILFLSIGLFQTREVG